MVKFLLPLYYIWETNLILVLFVFVQMIVGSLLSVIHVYSVSEEMRAAPVNTLNPQRTAMIIEDFIKVDKQMLKTLYHYFHFCPV